MNTNRKFYSKPQTLRTQVALEQGMCAGSIMASPESGAVARQHDTGFDGTFNADNPDESGFEVGVWN